MTPIQSDEILNKLRYKANKINLSPMVALATVRSEAMVLVLMIYCCYQYLLNDFMMQHFLQGVIRSDCFPVMIHWIN